MSPSHTQAMCLASNPKHGCSKLGVFIVVVILVVPVIINQLPMVCNVISLHTEPSALYEQLSLQRLKSPMFKKVFKSVNGRGGDVLTQSQCDDTKKMQQLTTRQGTKAHEN